MNRLLIITLLTWILLGTCANAQTSSGMCGRFQGTPCGSSLTFNEPIDQLALEASDGCTVTIINDTTIQVTDFQGCSITVTGTAPARNNGAASLDDSGGVAAAAPSSISRITINTVYRNNIFRPATVLPPPWPGNRDPAQVIGDIPVLGRAKSGYADVFVNSWEVAGIEGTSFGFNPSIQTGDLEARKGQVNLTLPMHVTSVDGGDTLFNLGLDGAWQRKSQSKYENLNYGGHANAFVTAGGDSTTFNVGAGPYVSYLWKPKDRWQVTWAGLLELTIPDEGDTLVELVPGANVGFEISENKVVNGYAIAFKNFDSDVSDDTYIDIGADFTWLKGAWRFTVGFRSTVGLDDVDSDQLNFGSAWSF